MKKTEIFTRVMLIILVLAALAAVVLQILNEKTNALETTYEIITFSVALVALIMAILQGLDNAKVARELHKIARETHKSLVEAKEINRDEIEMRREIREILKSENSHKK